MKKSSILFSALILAIGFGVNCGSGSDQGTDTPAPSAPETAAAKAMAELKPTEGSSVTGSVTFESAADGTVHVSATVSGLAAGKHGFHIHETGDCSAPDASSAGGHFNPGASDHGAPDSAAHHAGDFGNLEADESGSATYHATYNFVSLGDGPNSIIGKAVIVHDGEDDFVTQPTGAAGARLACGVVQKQ